MRKCAFGKFALSAVAVAAGLLGAAYFLGFGSHISTAWHRLSHDVRQQVPPEFEIARIRGELEQLGPEMRQNLDAVAKETVEVQSLRDDIAEAKSRLDHQKKVILSMKADLEAGNDKIVYGDTAYPASRIRDKLSRDFEAYKVGDRAVKVKEKLLEQKEKALAAHKEQIAQSTSVREQLEVELARLEAEYQMVKVAETKSAVQFDGSRLANIKTSVKELQNRIHEIEERQKLEAQFVKDPTVDVEQKAKSTSVVKDVDDYFGGKTEKDRVAEKK
jgi:LmbE family N-acetylglucosaminyl deacetylase